MLKIFNSFVVKMPGRYSNVEKAVIVELFLKKNESSLTPDLTPPDFFLWGYVKSKCYAENPQTIDELKQAITDVFATIDDNMLFNVFRGFQTRLGKCVERNGAHVEK